MRTRVKICGVRRPEDAVAAAEAGADAVGAIVYAPGSKREITPVLADEIFSALPLFVTSVGVCVGVHSNRLRMIMAQARFDLAQFHGEETPFEVKRAQPSPVVKSVKADDDLAGSLKTWSDPTIRNLRAILIDSAAGGGSGEPSDWSKLEACEPMLAKPEMPRLILAGGLTPESVGEVVKKFRPWAVDVSSGVEGDDGFKSADKMRAFVTAVRDADQA
ncbi:MAG: phosphoribosylanthranilate isomerase [Planctomycetota bacterium]